jgi:small acid-soluble spore protein D (minor alpha/beta-type SASP)
LKEEIKMASRNNRVLVPEAKEGLNRFKLESAREIGVSLKEGYNGDLTSRKAGSVGGQMVKKMVEAFEKNI